MPDFSFILVRVQSIGDAAAAMILGLKAGKN